MERMAWSLLLAALLVLEVIGIMSTVLLLPTLYTFIATSCLAWKPKSGLLSINSYPNKKELSDEWKDAK